MYSLNVAKFTTPMTMLKITFIKPDGSYDITTNTRRLGRIYYAKMALFPVEKRNI